MTSAGNDIDTGAFRRTIRDEFEHFLRGEAARFPADQCLRVDLHCHDHNSDIPDELWGRILRVPETWLETDRLVEVLRRNGSDVVTITNHNNARSCWALQEAGHDGVEARWKDEQIERLRDGVRRHAEGESSGGDHPASARRSLVGVGRLRVPSPAPALSRGLPSARSDERSRREPLRARRIRCRQIGRDLGRPGMVDQDVLPLLRRLGRATVFTRDLRLAAATAEGPRHRRRTATPPRGR
jgi:hypothetical protein